MDEKMNRYRQIVTDFINEQFSFYKAHSQATYQLLTDHEQNNFQLLRLGWDNLQNLYSPIFHFELKNGKVWIQRNMTETRVAEELIKLGVERTDIVLGFQPEYKRPMTEYAVA